MQKITPCLWFDGKAQEAARFYTSVFKNSKMGAITRYGDTVPGKKGSGIGNENRNGHGNGYGHGDGIAVLIDAGTVAALALSGTPAREGFVQVDNQLAQGLEVPGMGSAQRLR